MSVKNTLLLKGIDLSYINKTIFVLLYRKYGNTSLNVKHKKRRRLLCQKEKTTSKYLNSIEDKEHKKNKKIEVDRTYIEPQEFQSKKPKKESSIFVSRLNKPAKYTENSNFFSYLIYRIGKDDAAGLAAQMTYHFVLALFPMLIFYLRYLVNSSRLMLIRLIKSKSICP